MQLIHAFIYHLFAPTDRPRRSFRLRLALFGAAIPFMGWLSWQTAGTIMPQLGEHRVFMFCGVITAVFSHIIYILSDAAHKAFLLRLRPFHYLPLRPRILRRAQVLAYMPVTLAGGALVIPAVYAYCGSLPVLTRLAIVSFSFAFVAIAQVLMRTAEGWLGRCTQLISIVWVAGGLGVCWALSQKNNTSSWEVLVWVAMAMYLVLIGYAVSQPPRPIRSTHAADVREWERPGIVGSFTVRALRTWRYRGANIILFVLFFVLAVYVRHRQAIPFDLVALVSLLLCGTLGQEARAVSCTRYPTELVMYAKLGAWLRGVWVLAFTNAAIFIEVLLITAIILFPYGVGIPYRQVMCVGVEMIAIGIVAGSCIVSARNDVLAQLASTLLYGALAYWFIRLGGIAGQYEIFIAATAVPLSVALSYIIEHIRWQWTIRGRYASLF